MFRLLLMSCTMLSTSYVLGVIDPYCMDNCKCCEDEECHTLYGWMNSCVKGCIDGHRGARCYELCQYENCKTCGHISGSRECNACYNGYYLGQNKDCNLLCPSTCLSCTSSTHCTECKVGFDNRNGSTACEYFVCPGNCKCMMGESDCISCQAGYYDTKTLCSSACPTFCETCTSKDSCNICKNGFYNGYKNDRDVGLQLNNCTFKCRESCLSCHSYNNCSLCVNEKYGKTCEKDCSVGCSGGTCLIDSGNCSCSMNFTGEKCTECVEGKYGNFCNETCPERCKGHRCDRTSGSCTDGCVSDRFVSSTCNVCAIGRFGEMCDKLCPVNCINKICENIKGTCSYGCESNFNGPYCDSCIAGKFGQDCVLDCPKNCAGKVCEKTQGNCLSCVGKFGGPMCDTCKSGYYGLNCNHTCSAQCVRNTCDRFTGSCNYGCIQGFSGDKCCAENNNCIQCSSNTECIKCVPGYFEHLCEERCPRGCLNTCEISTGVCDGCQKNVYGAFCTFLCSENCNIALDANGSRCAPADGTCIYGCREGYYGSTCSKSCSSLCVGNVCRQDTGICVNGCNNNFDSSECFISSESRANDDRGTSATTAVIGTLFALSLLINIIVVTLYVKLRRNVIQSDMRRQRLEVTFENQLARKNVITSNSFETEINTSAERTNDYDAIIKTNGDEHAYQQL